MIQTALNLNRAVHGFGISLNQAEPQPHTALGAAAVAAVKALKDVGQVAFGNAHPRVFEIDADLSVSRCSGNGNRSVCGGVFYGVFQQIHYDALHLFPITLKFQRFRQVGFQMDFFLINYGAKKLTGLTDKGDQLKFFGFDAIDTGFGFGDIQHGIDHTN